MTTTMKRIFNHKLLSLLLCMLLACLLFTALAPQAHADASGTVGDGCSWTLDDAGNLIIEPTNGTSGTYSGSFSSNFSDYANITTITFKPGVKIGGSLEGMFMGLENVRSIDFSNVQYQPSTPESSYSADRMFYNCTSLTSVDLSWMPTGASAVNSAVKMFELCSSLESVNVSGWDTSRVTQMNNMFMNCYNLTSLDLSSFNTSRVQNMSMMFRGCDGLTNLNVSSFNTANVTNMAYMFAGCSGLTNLNVSSFNTANVTNMADMFDGCSGLTSLDLSNWNTGAVTDMPFMFRDCSKLTSLKLDGWDTRNVKTMQSMFKNCSGLTSLNVSHFNTGSVKNMKEMFYGCSALTSLDVSGWNTGAVTDMSYMFYNCKGLTSLGVSGWNTGSVTNMSYMFRYCSGLTSLDLSTSSDLSKWNTASVTNMSYMFADCSGLTSLDLSNWNTSKVWAISAMFLNCSGLTSLDVTHFDTSSVQSIGGMFSGCSSLTSLDVTSFNTSNVRSSMAGMFKNCSSLTSLDVSNFNTSNVTEMGNEYGSNGMFEGCSSLTSLDLSNFDTAKVKFMNYMFSGCSSLKSLNMSSWNTSRVTKMMSMFQNCSSLVILDLSNFNTEAITSASNLKDFLNGTTSLQAVALGSNTIANPRYWANSGEASGWVKYAELSGKRVYDGEEIEYLRNAQEAPGWYKLKNAPIPQNIELYSEFTSEEDEQTEFWVKEGNTWSYTFNVYDDTIPYWIWEEAVTGFNSEQTTPFKIEPDPDTGKIPAVVSILNTKPQETGSITIKKVVDGSVDNSFRFDITLTGDDISGSQKFGGVTFVNGSGYVFLADGESITLDGIPVGTSFSITEQQEAGYTPSWDKTPSGKIEEKDQAFSFICTNTPPPPPPPPPPGSADLHITKAVTGHYNHADDISFTFTVVFKGMVANKTYNYTAAGESLSFTTDASGTAYVTFILADGESADFLNLPVGSTYQVSEDGGDWAASYVITDANGGSKIVSSSGSATSGNPLNTAVETADRGEDVTVAYTNVLEKMQDIFIKKTVTGSAADKDMSFTLTVVFEGLTPGAYYNSDIGTIRADVDGRAERQFGMKDGDVFWFYGLPVGSSYVFTEEANPYIASFTVTDSAGGTAIVTPSGQNDKSRTDLSTGVELVDEDEEVGVTFTNRSVPLRDIPVTKIWDDEDDQDGKRPKSVEVQLLANGVALGDPVTLTRTKGWSYTWTDLDVYDDSNKEIEYSVKETKIEYYDEPVYGGDMTNGLTIENPYKPEETEVPVTKIWDDDDDRDGKRPESITVSLLADGKKIDETTLTAANKWTATFTGLDKYRDHGVEIVYTVEEAEVKYYGEPVYGGDMEKGLTITNPYKPEETEIPVTKIWDDDDDRDGKRPASITVSLLADGKKVDETTLTAANKWTATFTGLTKYRDHGEKIVYTVEEAEVKYYDEPVYGGDMTSGLTVTNPYKPEETEIPVTKIWDDEDNQDGKRPESITVSLLADGKKVDETKLTAANKWTATFTGLTKYRDHGKEIVYTVEEAEVEYYGEPVYGGDMKNGFTITNPYEPETTEISGRKIWDDADDQDAKRPKSVTVRLHADGKEIDSAVVSELTDWKYSFTDLPVCKDGVKIVYTVTEDAVSGYATQILDNNDVKNSYTPGKTSLSVNKVWDDDNDRDGLRPESIKVQLLANGKNCGDPVVLNAANKWSHTWTDLAEKSDGKEIVYTIKEVSVKGYSSKISGDATTGYTITNSHTPETVEVKGKKTWRDSSDRDGKRPDKITVVLLADGTAIDSVVVTEKDGWKWSFTDLPKNKDGKEIVYSVSELPVKEYSTTVKGYNIVNVYNPPNSPKTGDMEDYLRLSMLGILSLMGFGLTAVYWFRKTKRSK